MPISSIDPDSIYAGDGSLKAYSQAGLKRHVQGVQEYFVLQALNLPATVTKTFGRQIPSEFTINSIWANVPASPTGTLSVTLTASGSIIWQLDITTSALRSGFIPPFHIFQPIYDFNIVCTRDVPALWLNCQQVALISPPIAPII